MPLQRRMALVILAVAVVLLLAAISALAVTQPTRSVTSPPESPSATPATGDLGDLHAAGYTGENVSIGIVDVTGFDRSAAPIADQVVAARAFGPGATVSQGGHSDHGTAAATVAAETAPDADLYLTTFETQGGYQRAVQWLLANDVDVIVAPVSFYGTTGDGSTRVSRVATDAVRQDVVFVAAAGNLAESHWRPRYDAVTNGTLVVDGSRRNYLRGEGGHVTLWLSWNESRATEEYSLSLYRAVDGSGGRPRPELVARSRPFAGDSVANARLEADVAGGRYFVVVHGPDRPTGTRLRLTSPTHEFQQTTPRRSLVAPATAEGVLAVGAFDPGAGHVEPFSSRGPTADDRLGIDVVAAARHELADRDDPYRGTSAAAAYAGGVASLLREADPDRSPREVEFTIEATAEDLGWHGPDPTAGYGRLQAYRAVLAAGNRSG